MSREAPNSLHPAAPQSVEELEELLSRPTPRAVDAMRRLTGDLLILGVGGKMGPTLARMARRASDAAGVPRTIWGVSRFTSPATRARLEAQGITTIACDLLDAAAVDQLPSAPNVLFMTGMKFGAAHDPPLAWAMNCHAPALVCQKYRTSRIVAFSTGNVYGLVPVASGGSRETDPPRPDGEYAMMALGRERMFQYFSATHNTPVALVRLNYATELRYGVLVDLALDVHAGRPVDVSMGFVNVLWLADANAMTLAAFDHVAAPARIINMAGPEILRLRDVAQRMAAQFGVPVQLTGSEGPDALLNDGRGGYPLLGHPVTTADDMIRWTVAWVARGGENLGKPTRFQVRDGKF
ncbi:MAG: NAD-dependent epimerase/dehydratase family protein [Pirellulales bacterium]